jgi:hypothetical protein
MSLITDDGLIEIPALLLYENSLLEIADKERVEIDAKARLAVKEVRTELEIELDRAGMEDTSASASGFGLGNVVVTRALLRWLHSRALYLFFLESYGHQLNERFLRKVENYQMRMAEAKDTYLERGVGVVGSPLSRPGIPVTAGIEGELAAGNYYVAVAWVGAGGVQSALSPMTVFASDGAVTLTVSLANASASAQGWNVYVGTTHENAVQQNSAVIGPGQTWVMTQPWNPQGSPWGNGQQPTQYLQPQRVFLRG